jgi:hypothetical protein
VVALREAGRAYRKLGFAADHRSKRGWKQARSQVSKAEKAVTTRVAATA